MQVTVSRLSPVELELAVELPADVVRQEIDKAYATLSKKAHIKGYRPGKAPRSVLSKLFRAQVHGDVANTLVQTSLAKALTEQNVSPVSQPQVEVGEVDAQQAFSFKARFEVSPDVEDVKWEGLELERSKAEVDDKDVDEQLEAIRLGMAKLKEPEPARPAKEGDVLTIDFTLSIDGKKVKDGGGEGIQLELGSKQVIKELDEALRGKSVGDDVDATTTFPEDHPRQDFRGKPGTFSVKITSLKEKELPALDDELAKDLGQFETLVELRADIHTRLEKAKKDQSEMALAEQIVQQLNDKNPIDVPSSLVEQQCRMMEQEAMMQARRMGQRITEAAAKELHERIHTDAEKKVRAGLLMAAIAKKLEIKVTDEDIENGLNELAEQSGKNVNKLRAEYRDKNRRDMLVGMILEDKILDLIEGKAKIKDAE